MPMKKRTDILIVGGGASGLACAISAAQSSHCSVTLLDRMPRVGKKLLVTGNGRCNLSNRYISEEFYHGSFNVKPILEEFSDIRPFFEQLGLYTVCDGSGRIYPLSNTAASVLDALRFAAEEKSNIQIFTETPCTALARHNNGFCARAGENEIVAKAAVLACGGCAAPVQGSDGSGFAIAKSLGISVNTPYPALCALLADGLTPLDGVRSRCAASLLDQNGLVKKELGEVQFTKKALSGICIFNLSAAFKDADEKTRISLDLLPDYSANDAYNMLYNALKCRKRDLTDEIFSGIFNHKLALYLLKRANIPLSGFSSKLGRDELKRLARLSKNLDFTIKGRADFSAAQVTAGGVCGSEIDDRLMSQRVNGLFFAGEIIDIWGDCGGYNLHFAFASGIKAGREAVTYIEGR